MPTLGRLAVFCLLLVSAASASAAPIPVGLSHQGRLLEGNDQPVNAVKELTFGLYRTATGGTPVWFQVAQVDIADGYYSIQLGTADERPLTTALFSEPAFLGVKIGSDELFPRQPVSAVPYALRADLADRIEGGTIANATITGSQIDATKLTVGGQTVIDTDGRYVGPTDQLSAASLGSNPAAAYDTRAQAEAAYVLKAGDTMTGPLATSGALTAGGALTAAGTVTGEKFVSTATAGAPITVASGELVPNLNAEMVGGKKLSDIVLKTAFAGHDFTNLVLNGSFELGSSSGVATYWAAWGTDTGASRTVIDGGRFGAKAAALDDTNTTATGFTGLRQVITRTGLAAGHAGRTYTATVFAKWTGGTANGRICIADAGAMGAETSITCAAVPKTLTAFGAVSVTHTVSAAPQYLTLILSPTTVPAEAGTFAFDAASLTLGAEAPAFAPNPGEQVATTPIGSIVAWTSHVAGTPDVLPYGWAKCDGSTAASQGIPDAVITGALPALNTGRFLRGGASGVLEDDQFQAHTHANDISTNGGGASTSGGQSADHSHGGNTGNISADHSHSGQTGQGSGKNYRSVGGDGTSSSKNHQSGWSNQLGFTDFNDQDWSNADHSHPFGTGGVSANHTHAFTTGGTSANHTHTTPAHDHAMKGGVLGANSGRIGTETRPSNMGVIWIMRVK